MIIRAEQFQTLEAYGDEAYALEVAEHLKSFAPPLCEVVGDAAVREIARSGIRRARGYGLQNRGPVGFFLELMGTLGTGFDTDPQLVWASETLTDSNISSDMARAERLHEQMVAYLDVVAGPGHEYAIDALRRLLAFNFDEPEWSEQSVLTALGELYPQKFEFIGESTASRLFQLAGREAATYGLPAGKGGAALAGTLFAMGHRICEDPFYPWISATLKDPRIVDGEHRLKRLAGKLKTYGTHVLTYFSPS
jgi:hypothetical protein